ncbi:MAG: 16S rRNA (cytidine(1402)-2'-O)-methyltransferase [Candidatus Protistobacter heckmanni]|nr:16S rRNA (cytidine(1402)-2'-O)-methyltransferase [Candidatus Protistobacter heckmanni]
MGDARVLAAGQHYPAGALYVVATPIGNAADITLRALHVLELADAVACEDTRNTSALLLRYGLSKPLLAAHAHNEAEAAQRILARLQAGERIALVSDAGTPGISDPGARIVDAVRAAGLPVVPLPGASATAAAVAVSGRLLDAGEGAFCFAGFLPTKAAQRDAALRALRALPMAFLIYESPHRIGATLGALAALLPAGCGLLVCRELTKQFEEIAQLTVEAGPAWLAADAQRERGEFVLLVEGSGKSAGEQAALDVEKLLDALCKELPASAAARIAASLSGRPRDEMYQGVLARKPQKD